MLLARIWGSKVAGVTVSVDDTTARFLDMLCDVLDAEPARPDLDHHTGHQLEEIARVHEDWSRQVGALRLLLGVRLTDAAIRERQQWRTTP